MIYLAVVTATLPLTHHWGYRFSGVQNSQPMAFTHRFLKPMTMPTFIQEKFSAELNPSTSCIIPFYEYFIQRWRALSNRPDMDIVFESPVTGLEKDRDRTGHQPIRTGNLQDRSRP